ncbi:TPA: MFS transporter [Providencia stuartii]|nr:MFS transporter [Providencia stuartii]
MKWKYRFGAVAGNTLEYYDIAVFAAISGYLSAELERLGYNQATEMVWGIFALRFIARPVGGYIIGRYAQKSGKKSALILTGIITGTATLCMALLPIELLANYTPIIILILQMALSFSFGGEYPSLSTYLLNDAKKEEIGRISAIINCSSTLGIILSLGIVFILENVLEAQVMQTIGWRIPLFLGVLNIIISFWFRVKLPESIAQDTNKLSISYANIGYVFLLTIPGSIIFFVQNVSTPIFLGKVNVIENRTTYGLMFSTLLLVSMLFFGWFADKYSNPQKIYNLGVACMLVLSIPLFFLINSRVIELIILAQIIITLYAAMVLSNSTYMLFYASEGNVINFAIGFNLAVTMLGGITPLITSYLADINLIYIGVFLTFCGGVRFIAFRR